MFEWTSSIIWCSFLTLSICAVTEDDFAFVKAPPSKKAREEKNKQEHKKSSHSSSSRDESSLHSQVNQKSR